MTVKICSSLNPQASRPPLSIEDRSGILGDVIWSCCQKIMAKMTNVPEMTEGLAAKTMTVVYKAVLNANDYFNLMSLEDQGPLFALKLTHVIST